MLDIWISLEISADFFLRVNVSYSAMVPKCSSRSPCRCRCNPCFSSFHYYPKPPLPPSAIKTMIINIRALTATIVTWWNGWLECYFLLSLASMWKVGRALWSLRRLSLRPIRTELTTKRHEPRRRQRSPFSTTAAAAATATGQRRRRRWLRPRRRRRLEHRRVTTAFRSTRSPPAIWWSATWNISWPSWSAIAARSNWNWGKRLGHAGPPRIASPSMCFAIVFFTFFINILPFIVVFIKYKLTSIPFAFDIEVFKTFVKPFQTFLNLSNSFKNLQIIQNLSKTL